MRCSAPKPRKIKKTDCRTCAPAEEAKGYALQDMLGQKDFSEQNLKKRLKDYANEFVYSYIIDTIELNGNNHNIQTGSAPNFQGGVITLCTCKHLMRTYLSVEQWQGGVDSKIDGKWVAGFTGKNKGYALVFLARVGEAFESYADLLAGSKLLTPECQKTKSATRNILGDIYTPKAEGCYDAPHPNHVHIHKDAWEKDTKPYLYHKDNGYSRNSRNPCALLVFSPEYSFFWSKAELVRKKSHPLTRNCQKMKLQGVLESLI